MKYPNIIFFRYSEYSYIDVFFETQKDNLECNINITENKLFLNNLYYSNYHLLITFGNTEEEYYKDVYEVISNRMSKRWFHLKELNNLCLFNNSVNYCYVNNITLNCIENRSIFSVFTTCYNSYQKIIRAYGSLKNQYFKDWEWIVLDDSPDDNHFIFLKNLFKYDKRVRLFKKSENSGNIGNVKNEAVSLCRGKYILELDHDDEILNTVLSDACKVFDEDENIGFIYMDYANIYENGNNFMYGDFFALGYGGYYMQKYKDKWIYVSSTPNINNITLSHIVSIPNHPRIWRKDVLIKIGNYSEYLPVSDDYELFLRTSTNTECAKIHKLGYIQYMNDNNNNFSLIRNGEINRLCKNHLKPQCFNEYKINEIMKSIESYEDEEYMVCHTQIWKRENFKHKFCNKIINIDYKKIFCVISIEAFNKNIDKLKMLYIDLSNDFLILDNNINSLELCNILDEHNFSRMKCYGIINAPQEELIKYFELIYKSCENFEIITMNF